MRPKQHPSIIATTLFAIITSIVAMNAHAAREKPNLNPPPSLDELANATYQGIADTPITLSNGRWEGEPYQPGAASRPAVGLLKSLILHGDLNGDDRPESVAVLWANSGGSGSQLYLAIVARQGDKIVNLETANIGDRVQIRDGKIEGRGIVLDVIQTGPEDAACCPGQKARRSWMLLTKNDTTTLKEMPVRLVGRLSLADLENIDWQLQEPAGNKTDPKRKPITLRIEGQNISGYDGCNRYQAQAIPGDQPGDLKTGNILSTRMACPETDMARESHYLQQLSGVSRFSFRGAELLLSVNSGEKNSSTETLIFQKKP